VRARGACVKGALGAAAAMPVHRPWRHPFCPPAAPHADGLSTPHTTTTHATHTTQRWHAAHAHARVGRRVGARAGRCRRQGRVRRGAPVAGVAGLQHAHGGGDHSQGALSTGVGRGLPAPYTPHPGCDSPAPMLKHTHTHTHSHTRIHAYTHARMHAYTHTCSPGAQFRPPPPLPHHKLAGGPPPPPPPPAAAAAAGAAAAAADAGAARAAAGARRGWRGRQGGGRAALRPAGGAHQVM
jgi:hypothetical protein